MGYNIRIYHLEVIGPGSNPGGIRAVCPATPLPEHPAKARSGTKAAAKEEEHGRSATHRKL